jgi:hypothetical protein
MSSKYAKLAYRTSREREWGDDDEPKKYPRQCLIRSSDDWGESVMMGNCDVRDTPGLYWDLSGIEHEKIGKIKSSDGKLCVNYYGGISNCDDADDSQDFYLSKNGNLRAANTLNSRNRNNKVYQDGCIGYDEEGKLVFDNSGYGKNNRYMGDDSRVCERKFDIITNPQSISTKKECNPYVHGPDLTRVCNETSGEWVTKNGYENRKLRLVIPPMTNERHPIPQAPKYQCHAESRPLGRSYCDEYTNGWKCQHGWGGQDCQTYTDNNKYLLSDPFDLSDIVYGNHKRTI